MHLALRALIHSGVVKSAHDCSEGGLAVTLAESCISQHIARETPRLVGAQIDLSALIATPPSAAPADPAPAPAPAASAGPRLDALLFGETQGRVVISTRPLDAVKTIERAKLLGVTAARIGTVGGDKLAIHVGDRDLSWPVADLHDLWWNSIARAMR